MISLRMSFDFIQIYLITQYNIYNINIYTIFNVRVPWIVSTIYTTRDIYMYVVLGNIYIYIYDMYNAIYT